MSRRRCQIGLEEAEGTGAVLNWVPVPARGEGVTKPSQRVVLKLNAEGSHGSSRRKGGGLGGWREGIWLRHGVCKGGGEGGSASGGAAGSIAGLRGPNGQSPAKMLSGLGSFTES